MVQRMGLAGLLLVGWGSTTVFAAPDRYGLEPGSAHVTFRGQSTLHDFEGETDVVRGEMIFDPQQQRLDAPAQLTIPVETIRTGIEARDRAMRAMFEAARFPDVVVTIDSITPVEASAPSDDVPRRYRLRGRLRIRQVEQPIEFDVQATVTAEAVDASGALPLTTTMFDLKPPSVLGLIRVRKELTVEFDARWTRRP